MRKTYLIIYAFSAILAVLSCSRSSSQRRTTDSEYYSDTLRTLVAQWQHYREIGRQDSVIISGEPWLHRYIMMNDTVNVQYVGASMAQAYILVNMDYDSTRHFMEMLRPWCERRLAPNVASVYWNTMGHYALKYELDYAQSFSYYLKALEAARALENVSSQIVVLFNIVNIFYVRSDEHGENYAEEAFRLAENEDVRDFDRVAANIAMAQTRSLYNDPDSALTYLHSAHILSIQRDIKYFEPIIAMLYGDIFRMKGDLDRAGTSYAQALAVSGNAEPSLISQIYLNYGTLCEDMGRREEAVNLYLEGLKVSTDTHNMEFRKELLRRLASILYEIGGNSLAAGYYRQYAEFVDNYSLENKDQDFNNRQLDYVRMRYEYAEVRNSLALSESRRHLLVSVFIIVTVLILAAVFVILYVRQRSMYKEAVARYEEYRRRLLSENRKQESMLKVSESSVHADDMEKLYLRIEELMHSGAFKDKELSLDRMASLLGSNRTYISNAINQMSGCTFYQYLDTYRIKEATRILSDPTLCGSVPLKELADSVGYNSPQVFHKAFKKETGVTPGVYKAEVLKINEKKE